MVEMMTRIIWLIATSLILMAGFYFTFSLKFTQFNFKEIKKNLFKKVDSNKGITPIQTLMMSLAARIGIGSIAGVALAIYIGGVGTIFWIWVTAFLGTAISFSETIVGIIYRSKGKDGIYVGGPSFYISKYLGKPHLGTIYAILIIISYIGGFLGIQSNTISKMINTIIPVSPYIVGLFLVIVTSLIIYGGVKKIAKVCETLVPIMTIFYLVIALYVFITNISIMPNLFNLILKEAFNFKSITVGMTAMIFGIQRGIFSNEAGIGTGSIASSASSSNDAVGQGYIQMLGVYITSLVICTSTAIIVLTSNYQNLSFTDINGIELASFAFNYHLGSIGNICMFVAILLFSFSTILTGYYDGESSLKFIFKNIDKKGLNILKNITLIVLFLGTFISSTFLWNFVDLLIGILAIINIYALFKLRNEIKQEFNYYKIKNRDKIDK